MQEGFHRSWGWYFQWCWVSSIFTHGLAHQLIVRCASPLYNAELSAPELRGFLVSFYQFATIFGIMLSFWIGYGSNNIGGIGETQSDLAWRLPSIIQGIPAVLLAGGIWWFLFLRAGL